MNWEAMSIAEKYAYGASYLEWLKDTFGCEINVEKQPGSSQWQVRITIDVPNGPTAMIIGHGSYLHLAVHEVRSRFDPMLKAYGFDSNRK